MFMRDEPYLSGKGLAVFVNSQEQSTVAWVVAQIFLVAIN